MYKIKSSVLVIMSYAYVQVDRPVLTMDKTLSKDTIVSSSVWNTKAAAVPAWGIRPPAPETRAQTNMSHMQPFAPANVGKSAPYDLWQIQSARDPFAVQYLVNKYGGLGGTKLGTNLGR